VSSVEVVSLEMVSLEVVAWKAGLSVNGHGCPIGVLSTRLEVPARTVGTSRNGPGLSQFISILERIETADYITALSKVNNGVIKKAVSITRNHRTHPY
jgi:hypothetical protein